MTTYNTGNPVPSGNAKDRYDNSQTFDEFINGTLTYYKNRIGNNVLSLKGMLDLFNAAQQDRAEKFEAMEAEFENDFDVAQDGRNEAFEGDLIRYKDLVNQFLMSSGYEMPPIEYEEGAPVEVARPTQVISYQGSLYSVKLPASFPVILSGIWSVASISLVFRADQPLRQEISTAVNPALGSAMIGRGVVSIATLSDLMAIPESARRADLRYMVAEYAAETGIGGGEFRWSGLNLAAAVADDPYHGLTVPPSDAPTGSSGAFFRVYTGEIFADWFGVTYGQTVDATERLNAASKFVTSLRGLRVRGSVLISAPGTWDLSNLPPFWEVNVDGLIYAGPGIFVPLRLGGIYYKFSAKGMDKLGGSRIGWCYEMVSSFFGSLDMVSIDKFGEGPVHIGIHSMANGVNGIAWTQVNIKNVNVAGTCALFTTRTDIPGKTNGYVNENSISIGYMGGKKGIHFKRGPDQVERFGGNKILKPGFEQITDPDDAALDLEHCTRTTVEDWRFEAAGIKGLQIREDAGCSRNTYRGSWSLIDTKIQFGGILARVDAQIINEGGLTLAYGFQQSANGVISYFNEAPWTDTAYSNSIALRPKEPSAGYPWRLEVKGAVGQNGFIEIVPQVRFQQIPVSASASVVEVLPGVNIISVGLGGGSGGVTLAMPLALESSARILHLNVTSYNSSNMLSIRKSTGTVQAGAGITSAGLYSLAYFNDGWRISRLGDPYSF